jgi:hypothetical protein
MKQSSRVAVRVVSLVALCLATSTASLAGSCPWKGDGCWRHGWYGWTRALVVPPGQFLQVVQGAYPYHEYGYNNGVCIAYQDVLDSQGNLVGRAPVLIC